MAVDYTSVDFSTLGDTFKKVTQHMKGGFPIWEELLEKGQRLSRSFEHTQLHLASFFDTFAKIAEHCVHAKGATREIGIVITNLAMWHKGLEMRLREMSSALQQSLLAPMATRVEEWKKTEYTIEKEHDRDLSRAIKEAKDASKGTVKTERKLEEKVKKEKAGQKVQELRAQLNQRQQDTESKYGTVVAVAKRHLSRALVEERTWYCSFTDMFGKVMDSELALLRDMSHLQAIKQDLALVTSNPHRLPDKSVQVVESIIHPSDQRGETPTNLSPRTGSPIQPAASPRRVQSPPPPPPPPPPNISPTPPHSSISPTPSSASTASVTTPEVVPVEQIGSRLENGVPKPQHVLATSTSTSPVPSEPQPMPSFNSFSHSDLISASPAIRRHQAAVLQLQDQVGIVASPHIKRAVPPPPVAKKPSKLTNRDRCTTVLLDQPVSPPVSPIPRSSSCTTGMDTAEEEDDSPLLAAIKHARLRRVITNDRSTPALQGRVAMGEQQAPP